MTPRIHDIQLSQILRALKPMLCPQASLEKSLSIIKRARSTRIPLPEQREVSRGLETWFAGTRSSIFLLRVGMQAERIAKEVTTDVITLLQTRSLNIIWRLSPVVTSSDPGTGTISEMLKTLVYQILSKDASLLQSEDGCNAAKFESPHNEAEWLSLLQTLIVRMGKCYVVIEAQDLFHANKRDKEWPSHFLQILYSLVEHAIANESVVKILVLCYGSGSTREHGFPNSADKVVVNLRRPAVVPACRKNTISHIKKAGSWRRMQPRI